MRDAILKPAGAGDIVIGGDELADRKSDEVVYYGGGAYSSVKPERFDSHGGWIACAEDMVRFIMSLEDVGGTSPFKKRETWETLIAPPAGLIGHDRQGKPLPTYYGCGLRVIHSKNGTAINHTGSLSGTATFLWRRADGTSWAAFFNQRHGGRRDKAIVEPMNKALDATPAS